MSSRSEALAARLELGAQQLLEAAAACSQAAWQTVCPAEGRAIGLLIHHVASSYPTEMHLVQVLASGSAISGVTWAAVDKMNAEHAQEHRDCGKQETVELLRANSAAAAAGVRAMTDEQLDRAAPISLNWGAPLTTQYFIEEHPLRHSYQHLATIREALGADRLSNASTPS